jgi:hypothetical protein
MRGERREAKIDGAKLVPNSGRGYKKGDAVLDGWLIDYKHNASSFTLTRDNWKKHSKDAWNDGHYEPLIKVVFSDNSSVAIIDWDAFIQLKEAGEK